MFIDTSIKVVFKIFVFILPNINIRFVEKKLIFKSYIAEKVLLPSYHLKSLVH